MKIVFSLKFVPIYWSTCGNVYNYREKRERQKALGEFFLCLQPVWVCRIKFCFYVKKFDVYFKYYQGVKLKSKENK